VDGCAPEIANLDRVFRPPVSLAHRSLTMGIPAATIRVTIPGRADTAASAAVLVIRRRSTLRLQRAVRCACSVQ